MKSLLTLSIVHYINVNVNYINVINVNYFNFNKYYYYLKRILEKRISTMILYIGIKN